MSTGHDFSVYLTLSTAVINVASAMVDLEQAKKTLADYPETPEQDRQAWSRGSRVREAEKRLTEKLPALTVEVAAFDATTDELYRQYQAVVETEKARRDRHVAIRQELSTLPQLFIAV